MSKMIRIAIVDDQTLFREGLKRMLTDVPNYRVLASGAHGIEILEQLTTDIHVLLMDVF